MTSIGYFLSSEEHGPDALLGRAVAAEQAGFQGLWISDHYHPWNDEQGESSFVWAVIGALSQRVQLPVTTAVTCPTVRIHPAVLAQAAATAQLLLHGRFVFGVGSGEALNEHILGDLWPEVDTRLEMLEEAVHVIRELWSGSQVTHHGKHYDVVNARIYSLPPTPPPIYVSGFGSKSAELAGRIGDGFMTVQPDADSVSLFHSSGGAGKPVQGGLKVCWAPSVDEAIDTAHRLWPNDHLPGQLAQELALPALFEQASSLVTREAVAQGPTPLGPDVDRHVEAILQYAQAGMDEIYVQQIGPHCKEFFDAYRDRVLPAVRAALGS